MLTSVSAQRNARDSPLLRLAPELRNRIWTFVCAGHEIKIDEALEMWIGSAEYAIETSHQTVCDTDNHPEDQLYYDSAPDFCFLLVCRQIYAEAVLLPFSMNRFSFECFDYYTYSWFKDSLRAAQRNAFEHIHIGCDDYGYICIIDSIPSLKIVSVKHEEISPLGVCLCTDIQDYVVELFGMDKVEVRIEGMSKSSQA
jgi:hypothetical protein